LDDEYLPNPHGYYLGTLKAMASKAAAAGIGTPATAETKDALAAKGLLRHSNVATTTVPYVKDVPEAHATRCRSLSNEH